MPQLEIRTSERKSFKRCPKRWEWSYKDGNKPLRESNPLWFGQAVHLALAEWYRPGQKRGPHPAKTFVEAIESDRVKRFDPKSEEDQAEYVEHLEMGVDMLNRYVDEFGKDEDWEMIQPEMTFQVWFKHPRTGQKRWLRYVGTIDGVVRYIGETTEFLTYGDIFLLEHKTAASINVQHLPLDDQAGSYWALAGPVLRKKGVLKPGEEIAGILYNFLRKAKNDPRPMNEDGFYCNKPTKQNYLDTLTAKGHKVSSGQKIDELAALADEHGIRVMGDPSKMQPPPYFERIPVFRNRAERKTMLQRITDEGLHIEDARKDQPLLPIVKNPTKDCSWDCEFFRMCQLHEAGEDWEGYRDVTFRTWNPYEEHTVKSA